MTIYKFKVAFDDPEDVTRDIEIKPGQTFEDLHKAIQAAIKFDASAEADFYTSDDYWRKETRIRYEELKSIKVSKYIEDPHQKFIYEYDPKNKWVLTVELFKILQEEPGAEYPRCVKSVGKAPAQYHNINAVLGKEDMQEVAEEDLIDDALFYREPDEMLSDEDVAGNRIVSEGEEDMAEEQGEESEFEESDYGEEPGFEDEY